MELVVFILKKVEIVRPIINLSSWTLVDNFNTRHTVVGNRSIDSGDFSVVTDSGEIGFLSSCGAHSHACCHSLGGWLSLCHYLKI